MKIAKVKSQKIYLNFVLLMRALKAAAFKSRSETIRGNRILTERSEGISEGVSPRLVERDFSRPFTASQFWYFCCQKYKEKVFQQKTVLAGGFRDNSGSEFPDVTEQASFILSPTDSSATPLSADYSTTQNPNKKALISEGLFISVEAPKWSFKSRILSPFGKYIIPRNNSKSNLLKLRQSRRGDLHPLPSGDNPDAPLSEFRRQTATGAHAVYHIMSIFLLLVTCYLLFVTFTHTALASDATQSATPSAQVATPSAQVTPLDTTTLTPQSPQYANLIVNNLLHAFSCLAAGTSPIGQPCVDYLNGIPVASQVNTSGGLLGAVTNLNTLVIANPPIRTGQYLATIGDSLGLVKEAHAQVGGSGEGVLRPILSLWQVSRNISYVFMIIIFVVIGLMVMFRTRINPQTVISLQAALPGLVIGLVMITFSYFLASLVTDTAYLATNLIGFYFQSAQGQGSTSLVDTTSDHSVLSVFGRFVGSVTKEDLTGAAAAVFNNLDGGVQNVLKTVLALVSYQYGSQVGSVSGAALGAGGCLAAAQFTAGLSFASIPICATIGNILGGITGGGAVAIEAIRDPQAVIGLGLYVLLIAAFLYTMFKLLLRLISSYLSIIFLTITAPFHFLAASLPGRQEIGIDWIRNMLCNVLAFPAVLGVFYFVAYILGPTVNTPFGVTTPGTITGSNTLPLFGGLDVHFIQLLLAIGALLATPAIPDVICQAIGKVGRAGALIGQEISGSTREGRGYLGQAQGGFGNIQKDVGGLGQMRNEWEPTLDARGNVTGWRLVRMGLPTKAAALGGTVSKPPKPIF